MTSMTYLACNDNNRYKTLKWPETDIRAMILRKLAATSISGNTTKLPTQSRSTQPKSLEYFYILLYDMGVLFVGFCGKLLCNLFFSSVTEKVFSYTKLVCDCVREGVGEVVF